MVRVLKDKFKKGSVGRKVYDRGEAVIRLFSSRGAAVNHFSTFFFVGCGNLQTGVFYLHELLPASLSDDLILASLQSSSGIVLTPTGRPLELYDVVEKVYHRDIHCDLYCLRLEAGELMAEFRPVAVVSQVAGDESAQIWPDPKPTAKSSSRSGSSRVPLPAII